MKKSYEYYIKNLNNSLDNAVLHSTRDIENAIIQEPDVNINTRGRKMKWIISSAALFTAAILSFVYFYQENKEVIKNEEHSENEGYFNVKGLKALELTKEELENLDIKIVNDSIFVNIYEMIFPANLLKNLERSYLAEVPDSIVQRNLERSKNYRINLLKKFKEFNYPVDSDSFKVYHRYALNMKRIDIKLLPSTSKHENAQPLVFIYSRHSSGDLFNPKHSSMSLYASANHPLFYNTAISKELKDLVSTLKPHRINETQFLKRLVPIRIKIGKNVNRDQKEVMSRQKKDGFNYAEYNLFYEATPEFINMLPERYREELRKELNIIESFEHGAITKEEACSNISDKHDYFNFCESFSSTVSDIMLYPYPAQEDIYCSFDLKTSCKVTLILYDLDGIPVKTLMKDKYFQKGKQVEKLDLRNIKRGMYMLSIVPAGGDQAAVKLIK